MFSLFLWVILRLHFPPSYTADRTPSWLVLTQRQALCGIRLPPALYAKPGCFDIARLQAPWCSIVTWLWHISYSKVFAHWNGCAGNLQGKYNAGKQSLGVLSIRSLPAQLLCNTAWNPCHLGNSCNGWRSDLCCWVLGLFFLFFFIALRRWKVLYKLSILIFIGRKSPAGLILYDCNYIKLSFSYRVHLALQVPEVPKARMELM